MPEVLKNVDVYIEAESIWVQWPCDGEGCDKGLLSYPARFCSKCNGDGLLYRTFQVLGAVTT